MNMNSTSTQFVTSRRMGAYEAIHHISMWGETLKVMVAESKLSNFIADIIVPPRMVYIINDGEVNDEYMRILEILTKKLKFIGKEKFQYFYRNSTFGASPSLPAPICTPSLPAPICNMDMEGVGTLEVHRKGQKFYRKKENVEGMENHQSDDGGEACSGTEGLNVNALKGKVDAEFSNAKA
ncbi:hypothetical protein FNV43_RR21450 [Rhamnella rubrinervis]|uniref:Vps52 coiled-coil domain-containing protein n=1 Tax=Rhamnella rubrinervis TaxID=2594499 RepID=A0A8K0GV31_9ROSA|nr:hypothetical protein FNV43_RR21450 [Rhamnella rubrinervis]